LARHQLPNPRIKSLACHRPNLQAKAAQNPPDAQFNVDKPPKKLFARNQQRSHLLRSSRFGVCTGRNQPIRISWASPRASLRSVFTVIADKAAFTCRFQQNSFKSGSLQPRMQPLRQWPRLKSYPLHSKTKRLKESNQSCRPLEIFASFTILPSRPQRKRSTVPMTRRSLHSVNGCPPSPDAWGPTQRRDPVSSSIGGQPPSAIARCRAHYGI